MRFHTLNLLALVATATSFTIPQQNIRLVTPTARVTRELMAHQQPKFDSCDDVSDHSHLASSTAVTISTSALLWAASAQAALADSPDWGLFEGRIGSLLHPLTMLGLLGFSISTALLGFNWKRQRTMGDEISALKKTLPDLQGAKSVSEALAAAKSADPVDQGRVNALQASMSIENEIDTLQKERKDLAAANPRDQHFSQGSLLAFLGTAFAIEGPLNTYARAGKLFPGPHLYAGAGLVVLWALAASCVPAMQKGNDAARTVHIAANVAGIGLFGWQVVSGLPILFKVIEKTSWP